jgi:hypothetical protein
MTELRLDALGVALSGRSRAREFLSGYPEIREPVVIDFSNIQACNQSFLNEATGRLRERFERERQFFSNEAP